ncbi:MAG: arylsulfatase [Candidatus Sumerlaeia bacterium]|nr:arylsulfatase [Candidatus Sumerlaeia bacterium]
MTAHNSLSRRNFLRTAAFSAATWALAHRAPLAAAPQAKPNIVFILADDLGYGDPQCNNPDSKVPTPHFDRLAHEGIRFTDAHTGSSVCTPTRYGILTGRYCWRTSLKRGVLGGYSPRLIEPGRLTVASLLKQNGYATACIGKWHLGMDWGKKGPGPVSKDGNSEENVDFSQPIQNGPNAVGFDYYFGISASLDMPPYIFIENDRLVGSPTARQPKDGPVRAGAKAPDFTMEGVLPTLTKKAVEFIESHAAKKSGQPFFLYFSLNAPHTPVVPADFVKGKSKAGPYGDFVHQVDHSLGEVLAALDRCKIADNTLLIMTSDNGSTNPPMTEYDHLPNGRLRGRKSTIWDGGHRVPFVARWSGKIRPGTTSDETIWLGDFMATCAAIVGAELPRDAAEDSINILPALLGETRGAPLHEAIVHHSIDGMFAIRAGRWKLILGRGSGGWDGKGNADDPPGQLYDMSVDVEEKENLYTKHPDIVERLTALLKKYEETGRSRP